MKQVTTHLKSLSPYGQSKVVTETKKQSESHEEFEQRIWRSKMSQDDKGNVFIQPTAFKNCLAEAAKYLSIQIPGKGKSTFTKHIESGVLCTEPAFVGINIKEVEPLRLFVPASGKRGDGKRVWKTFPHIQSWECDVTWHVLDDTVMQEMPADEDKERITVFEHILSQAGLFVGVGFFRPRNNGYFGRFSVESFRVS